MHHLAECILPINHFIHETKKTKSSNLDTIKNDQPSSWSAQDQGVFMLKLGKFEAEREELVIPDMTHQER